MSTLAPGRACVLCGRRPGDSSVRLAENGGAEVTGPSSVSVVMPTYNRCDRVCRAVEAIDRQHVDLPVEIVVVSDGSTDDTGRAVRSLRTRVSLHYCEQANAGPAAARNLGVDEAGGDLVVFIDDDVIAGEGLLQAHVDAHRRLGDDVVVIGPMLDPDDFDMAPWVRWEQAMLRKQYAALVAGEYDATARQFYTGNASVLKRHVVAAGGFDPTFRRAEDVELAYRLDDRGVRFAFVPSAVGYHYADRSYAAWKSAAYLYGRNDVRFARDLGRAWIYPFMQRKLAEHRRPLRWAIACALASEPCRRAAVWAAQVATTLGDRAGREGLVRSSLSAIYGIEYHAGVRDELGGRAGFLRLVRTGQP